MLRNDINTIELERLAILWLRGEKYKREGMQPEGEAYFQAYFELSDELGMTWEQASGLHDFIMECKDDEDLMGFTGYTVLRDGLVYAEAEDYLVGTVRLIIQRDGESQTF